MAIRLLKIIFAASYRICGRVMRIAAFNALLIAVGLALIAVAGEVYFRVSAPYGFAANPKDFYSYYPRRFVPNVGIMPKPNSIATFTNHMDYWVITRTNSLGFVDREPITPERAAESCHIALIGDSFVDAKEVDIADKAQVKLEEIAARELPHLDITASAYGLIATGQVNQLAFYDEYARHLRPKVVALVFVPNDFSDNSTIMPALTYGIDPEHMTHVTAERDADGTLELRPPDPNYRAFMLPPPSGASSFNGDNNDVKSYAVSFVKRSSDLAKENSVKYSYLAKWLSVIIKTYMLNYEGISSDVLERIIWRAELLRQRPRYSALLQEWTPTRYENFHSIFEKSNLSPFIEDALAYTEFGLAQFKQRSDRDGANLVILSTHSNKLHGNLLFERLTSIAEDLDIPVIDQHKYIIDIGADPRDAEWKYDAHWNKNGHRWAAEALLEWLRDNQGVCDERG